MTPSEYKDHKNIPKKFKANLRDNMTDLGLIFTMLGERVTTEISNQEDFLAESVGDKKARMAFLDDGDLDKTFLNLALMLRLCVIKY